MRGASKYSSLLEDVRVARWAKNLARGSPITSEVAVRRLGKLCGLLAQIQERSLLLLARALSNDEDAMLIVNI
jgi:hypothetical protein